MSRVTSTYAHVRSAQPRGTPRASAGVAKGSGACMLTCGAAEVAAGAVMVAVAVAVVVAVAVAGGDAVDGAAGRPAAAAVPWGRPTHGRGVSATATPSGSTFAFTRRRRRATTRPSDETRTAAPTPDAMESCAALAAAALAANATCWPPLGRLLLPLGGTPAPPTEERIMATAVAAAAASVAARAASSTGTSVSNVSSSSISTDHMLTAAGTASSRPLNRCGQATTRAHTSASVAPSRKCGEAHTSATHGSPQNKAENDAG